MFCQLRQLRQPIKKQKKCKVFTKQLKGNSKTKIMGKKENE